MLRDMEKWDPAATFVTLTLRSKIEEEWKSVYLLSASTQYQTSPSSSFLPNFYLLSEAEDDPGLNSSIPGLRVGQIATN